MPQLIMVCMFPNGALADVNKQRINVLRANIWIYKKYIEHHCCDCRAVVVVVVVADLCAPTAAVCVGLLRCVRVRRCTV